MHIFMVSNSLCTLVVLTSHWFAKVSRCKKQRQTEKKKEETMGDFKYGTMVLHIVFIKYYNT